MKAVWTQTARHDLESSRDYILEHEPRAASRIAAAIHHSVETLTQSPARGRPGRLPGTRELVIVGTSYVVAYKLEGDVLVIVAVLHAARRWPSD